MIIIMYPYHPHNNLLPIPVILLMTIAFYESMSCDRNVNESIRGGAWHSHLWDMMGKAFQVDNKRGDEGSVVSGDGHKLCQCRHGQVGDHLLH